MLFLEYDGVLSAVLEEVVSQGLILISILVKEQEDVIGVRGL